MGSGAADGWHMHGEEQGCRDGSYTYAPVLKKVQIQQGAAWLLEPEIRNTVLEMVELRRH